MAEPHRDPAPAVHAAFRRRIIEEHLVGWHADRIKNSKKWIEDCVAHNRRLRERDITMIDAIPSRQIKIQWAVRIKAYNRVHRKRPNVSVAIGELKLIQGG